MALRQRIVDDDETNLDDGELPSLSSRPADEAKNIDTRISLPYSANAAIPSTGRIHSVAVSTGISTNAITNKPAVVTPSVLEHNQKFWSHPNRTPEGIREPRFNGSNTSGYVEEESGPHDEMAARRATTFRDDPNKVKKGVRPRRRSKTGKYKSDSDDESTEYAMSRAETYESDSFDEDDDRSEETRGEFDQTFCGQTLTAIGDFCGGGLATTADSPLKKRSRADGKSKKRKSLKSDSLSVPNVVENQTSQQSLTSGITGDQKIAVAQDERIDDNHTAATRRVSEDLQQENTAIEVEFVEPTPAPTLERKNAVLDALAKKAKDSFEDSQKKKEKQGTGDVPVAKATVPLPGIEQPIPMQRTASEAQSISSVKSDEDVYNSMTTVEKRKFLSYINSGNTPYEATKKVLKERSKRENQPTDEEKRMHDAAQQLIMNQQNKGLGVPKPKDAKARVLEKAKENAKRFSFWKRASKSNDSEESGKSTESPPKSMNNTAGDLNNADNDAVENSQVPQDINSLNKTISNDSANAKKSFEASENVVFEKSGSVYYDAILQEQEENLYENNEIELDTIGRSRSSDRNKRRQFVVPLPNKVKGFEELKDSEQVTDADLVSTSDDPRSIPLSQPEASDSQYHHLSHVDSSGNANKQNFSSNDVLIESSNNEMIENESHNGDEIIHEILSTTEPKSQSEQNDEPTELDLRNQSSEEHGQRKESPRSYDTISNETEPIKGTYSDPPREVDEMDLRIKKGNEGTEQDGVLHDDHNNVTNLTEINTLNENLKYASDGDMEDPNESHTEHLDVSIETYFNATAGMSSPQKSGSKDATSVYTIGTNITSGSTYSQSSRVRRPGAAKSRLAKQKEVENKLGKKNGWHESIKAAALSTNRVWDAKKGWVDYRDPDIDAIPDTSLESSNDRIRIDLDKSVLSKSERDVNLSASTDPAVDIPFPSDWERERLEMLDSQVDDSTNVESPETSALLVDREEEVEKFTGLTSAYETEGANTNTKPKGWLESMKAASAALAKTGVKWDPVHGWTKADVGKESSLSDSVGADQSRGLTTMQQQDTRRTYIDNVRDQDAAIEVDTNESYDTGNGKSIDHNEIQNKVSMHDDFVQQNAPRETTEIRTLQMIEEKEGFAMVRVAADPSAALQFDDDMEDDGIAVNSPYKMRMSASGSTEERKGITDARLSSGQRAAFLYADDLKSSSAVHVVKEKVDINDMELFGDSSRTTNKSMFGNQAGSIVSAGSSRDSSLRRGAGPVDVDEVDETWESDDDQRQSTVWQSGSVNNSIDDNKFGLDEQGNDNHIKGWRSRYPSPSVSAMNGRNVGHNQGTDATIDRVPDAARWDLVNHRVSSHITSDSRSAVSASTLGSTRSSLSKKVPKLERSKRDTSPISTSRKSGEKSIVYSPLTGTVADVRQSDVNFTSMILDEKKDDTQQKKGILATPGIARGHQNPESGTEERKVGTESELAEDRYTYSPEEKARYARGYRANNDFTSSPTVKDRLEEWESRIEKSTSIDNDEGSTEHYGESRIHDHRSNSTEEWKSFLGKKVRAENEAALRQASHSRRSKEENNERRHAGLRSEEEDSIFVFREAETNNANSNKQNNVSTSLDDISDLSPINHTFEVSDNEKAVSEAYGPTEQERGLSSFFQRLSACTAPIIPHAPNGQAESSVQSSHLEFLRSIPQSAAAKRATDFVSSSFACVNPEANDKVESEDSTKSENNQSLPREEGKPRSASVPRSSQKSSYGLVANSSASEDFGAKTAYLEALASRAAVANPKRSSSRRRERSSGASSVVSGATESSEKWQAFLERKRAASAGTTDKSTRSNSHSEVSRAAEKYAAEKVEEMMLKMSERSKSAPKDSHYHRDIDNMLDTSGERYGSSGERKIARKKGSAVRAAEDLAAARVEAMMAALSTNHLDEGEI